MSPSAGLLLVVVECPLVATELREELRCPANTPIRCEHAADLGAAREALAQREFDLILLVSLEHDPAELIREIAAGGIGTRIVVVADDAAGVARALDAGAAAAFERGHLPEGVLSQLLASDRRV